MFWVDEVGASCLPDTWALRLPYQLYSLPCLLCSSQAISFWPHSSLKLPLPDKLCMHTQSHLVYCHISPATTYLSALNKHLFHFPAFFPTPVHHPEGFWLSLWNANVFASLPVQLPWFLPDSVTHWVSLSSLGCSLVHICSIFSATLLPLHLHTLKKKLQQIPILPEMAVHSWERPHSSRCPRTCEDLTWRFSSLWFYHRWCQLSFWTNSGLLPNFLFPFVLLSSFTGSLLLYCSVYHIILKMLFSGLFN